MIYRDAEQENSLKMIRIVLVDNQPEVRRGLRMNLTLEPDFEIVGEAQDGLEALSLVEALHPDVVIMDIRMPVMDGVTVVER
jgi:YesN/AraC family two-component response regulator